MPIKYTIDRIHRVVYTEASGILTEEELIQHKHDLVNHPDFMPGMVELSDAREVREIAISPAGLQRFTAIDASYADLLKDYKLAIVVTADLAFGMARMYEMMTSGNIPNVHIFRDMEEAKKWLGRF